MSDYIQDPNNSKKQVPGNLPDNAYDRFGSPDTGSYVKTPNAVIIGDVAGDVGFFLGSSASFAEKMSNDSYPEGGVTGSVHYTNFGTPAAGTTLNIHPIAWSGSAADNDAGRVTFIYSSGLSTGRK